MTDSIDSSNAPLSQDWGSGGQRSNYLMNPARSVLAVIDVQQRLIEQIIDHARVVSAIGRLIDGAKQLGIPILVSEQYPERLGATVPELASKLPQADHKRMFSCRELWPTWDRRLAAPHVSSGMTNGDNKLSNPSSIETEIWPCRDQWILCGIEAHVCVLQTALDFASFGCQVAIPADAVGSRDSLDRDTAFRRMESHGVQLLTSESVLFEWCETSQHPHFKAISELVKSRSTIPSDRS